MGFIDDMREYSKQSFPSQKSDLTDSIIQDMTHVVINAIELNLKDAIGYKHVRSSNGVFKQYYYQDSFTANFSLRDCYATNLAYDNDSIGIDVKTTDDIVRVMRSIISSLSEFSSYKVIGQFDKCFESPLSTIDITDLNCSQAVNKIIRHNIKNGGPKKIPHILFRIDTTISCHKDGTVK